MADHMINGIYSLSKNEYLRLSSSLHIVDFVGIPPFLRITLWVAMETKFIFTRPK